MTACEHDWERGYLRVFGQPEPDGIYRIEQEAFYPGLPLDANYPPGLRCRKCGHWIQLPNHEARPRRPRRGQLRLAEASRGRSA